MYFPRSLGTKIIELSHFFPALVVTGARQSGKSTLLKKIFPNHNYVTLDLPSIAEQAENNSGEFLERHSAPLIIDEIQYAPGLFRRLKIEIDENRHNMGSYVLTGSQHFTLMKGVSDSLAGRCAVLELENLSYREISDVCQMTSDRISLLHMMSRGMFPELWRVPEMPHSEFYGGYLATYLERDVRQILNVTSLRDFERFIRILATRSGGMLNKSDIAKDTGVSSKAIGDWLSVLQASGQIILLEPWFTNIGKRAVRSPKVYFRDSGLLCFLLNLTSNSLAASPMLGAVWETFVFSELRKRAALSKKRLNFWHYRDQRVREIDFIIEEGGKLTFAECKWRENPSSDDGRFINAVSRDLQEQESSWRPGHNYIIATPQASYDIAPKLTAVTFEDIDRVLSQ